MCFAGIIWLNIYMTRREFIKILTGTVIAISLPVGLFSDGKTKTEETIILSNVEFTLTNIEIVPLKREFGWFMRGMGTPIDKRIPPKYFAVKIDDIETYNKEEVLVDVRCALEQSFKNLRT